MKPAQFLWRVAAIIIGVGTFNILGMELLIICIMGPTLKELPIIMISPLPAAIPLLGGHILISIYYLRPVRAFLEQIDLDKTPDPELITSAEARVIDLTYFLALLSFPAYILGGIFGYGLMVLALPGWPAHVIVYGALSGVIAGLLTIPMSEHFSAWAITPVLATIRDHSSGRAHSRNVGRPMPLRRKFVLLIVVMVVAFTGYTVIISYGLYGSVLDNMQKIESLLPAETAGQLARDSFGTADDRIKSVDYFQSRMGSVTMLFVGVMIVGTLLALLVSLGTSMAITWPINMFKKVAEKIQAGQYNEKISIIANDEFAHMGASINRMTDTLLSQLEQNRALIDGIREAVETLSPLSRQLVDIADQQTGSSEQQEAAAKEAADMGKIIAGVARRIAENTARITRDGEKTRDITLAGQQKLKQTETTLTEISARMKDIVQAMDQLEEQSREIDSIVQTINQISSKTNILSINAGIEALKAGDKGSRFGVVAREIRFLAQDSRESTMSITRNLNRIRSSLASSVLHVEEGEQAVAAGKEVMTQMTEHFEKILYACLNANRDLDEIESITSHQASTNQQLNDIIRQIKTGAQETTSATEKTRNTLKSLEQLVNQLQAHTQQSS